MSGSSVGNRFRRFLCRLANISNAVDYEVFKYTVVLITDTTSHVCMISEASTVTPWFGGVAHNTERNRGEPRIQHTHIVVPWFFLPQFFFLDSLSLVLVGFVASLYTLLYCLSISVSVLRRRVETSRFVVIVPGVKPDLL